MVERVRSMRKEVPPKERLVALHGAVGNNEAIAIVFLLMQPSLIYTKTTLQEAVLDAQGSPPVWKLDKKTLYDYCEKSLQPAGLVEWTYDPLQKTWGYKKTEFGEHWGDSFAGDQLDLSLEHPEFSLEQLWGQSATTSPHHLNAPATRVQILEEVLKNLPMDNLTMQSVDFVRFLNIDDQTVSKHLRALSSIGVINFRPMHQQRKRSEISLTDEQRNLILRILSIFRAFESQTQSSFTPTLDNYRQRGLEIVATEENVKSLLEKAKKASSHANQIPKAQMCNIVLTLIMANPGCTNRQIQEELYRTSEIERELQTVAEYTAKLLEDRKVVRDRGAEGYKYSIAS